MTEQIQVAKAPVLATPIARMRTRDRRQLSISRQVVLQLLCLLITATVMFPLLWVVSMALDPRNISRPTDLSLIPPGASLDAFNRVLARPTLNPVSFAQLAFNSLFIAFLISVTSVVLGILAAYAFSRMRFPGRAFLMIAVLAVLMLPAIATLAPLFTSMNKIQVGTFNLRNSLVGVALAVTAGQLPFAIWNIKGYLDTIPRELEEAATVDGAGAFAVFRHVILPLSTPVIAVTAFFGFLAGWTEFYFSWSFLSDPKSWTLAMALNGMVGQYAANTRWSEFAAFAILVALPVAIVYLFLQRYIISGLTVGGVKG
ncbi:MAG: arabinogalactan oligomer / maltooligosaccharide transport system permease protein [Chloroflexota bacterium]|jgi:arabinogalactan oligomer/maltooligosaccharide transport system permease protein|nr:arabinogalactan oligomer / maltooligosaccharide transport system permease protein [Chloroflexota bacterium]